MLKNDLNINKLFLPFPYIIYILLKELPYLLKYQNNFAKIVKSAILGAPGCAPTYSEISQRDAKSIILLKIRLPPKKKPRSLLQKGQILRCPLSVQFSAGNRTYSPHVTVFPTITAENVLDRRYLVVSFSSTSSLHLRGVPRDSFLPLILARCHSGKNLSDLFPERPAIKSKLSLSLTPRRKRKKERAQTTCTQLSRVRVPEREERDRAGNSGARFSSDRRGASQPSFVGSSLLLSRSCSAIIAATLRPSQHTYIRLCKISS